MKANKHTRIQSVHPIPGGVAKATPRASRDPHEGVEYKQELDAAQSSSAETPAP